MVLPAVCSSPGRLDISFDRHGCAGRGFAARVVLHRGPRVSSGPFGQPVRGIPSGGGRCRLERRVRGLDLPAPVGLPPRLYEPAAAGRSSGRRGCSRPECEPGVGLQGRRRLCGLVRASTSPGVLWLACQRDAAEAYAVVDPGTGLPGSRARGEEVSRPGRRRWRPGIPFGVLSHCSSRCPSGPSTAGVSVSSESSSSSGGGSRPWP